MRDAFISITSNLRQRTSVLNADMFQVLHGAE